MRRLIQGFTCVSNNNKHTYVDIHAYVYTHDYVSAKMYKVYMQFMLYKFLHKYDMTFQLRPRTNMCPNTAPRNEDV